MTKPDERRALRAAARFYAVQALFQMEVSGQTVEQVRVEFENHRIGVETEGETSLIFFDGAFSHAVQKIPVPGDYRVQDDFGASDRPTQVSAAEIAAAAELVAAAGGEHAPLLYARVDMMRDEQGRWVLAELEAVEPSLFFRHDEAAPGRLADALVRRLA